MFHHRQEPPQACRLAVASLLAAALLAGCSQQSGRALLAASDSQVAGQIAAEALSGKQAMRALPGQPLADRLLDVLDVGPQ